MPLTPDNFTALNTSDFNTWLAAVNSISSNWMGAGIMLTAFLATFITIKSNAIARTSEAFAVASFVTWLVASILLLVPVVSVTLWAASLSLMILGGVWLWMGG